MAVERGVMFTSEVISLDRVFELKPTLYKFSPLTSQSLKSPACDNSTFWSQVAAESSVFKSILTDEFQSCPLHGGVHLGNFMKAPMVGWMNYAFNSTFWSAGL